MVINLGVAEERVYAFEVRGLEASRFVQRMELDNIAATGTFDGTVPIVFDAMGNGRLQGGRLVARPPGGNLSYVGQLTYEDLSPVGNFAFAALRSLDYDAMVIEMNGPLTGELVTQVRIDGVSQGAGAEQNFITRRVAELPVRLIVNIRAPFYRLITSIRSIYDSSAVRDPRELGLLGADGTPLQQSVNGEDIQPPESEDQP
jgi:hypothetical protein